MAYPHEPGHQRASATSAAGAERMQKGGGAAKMRDTIESYLLNAGTRGAAGWELTQYYSELIGRAVAPGSISGRLREMELANPPRVIKTERESENPKSHVCGKVYVLPQFLSPMDPVWVAAQKRAMAEGYTQPKRQRKPFRGHALHGVVMDEAADIVTKSPPFAKAQQASFGFDTLPPVKG